MTRKPRRSPVRQYGNRDASRNLDLLPSETAGGLNLMRPKTAENVEVPAEQSRLPLFGEVVAGAGNRMGKPGTRNSQHKATQSFRGKHALSQPYVPQRSNILY